jgi:hypothetical protein
MRVGNEALRLVVQGRISFTLVIQPKGVAVVQDHHPRIQSQQRLLFTFKIVRITNLVL